MDQHYEGACSNIITVMRGWGVQSPEKKRYVTLERPLSSCQLPFLHS